MSEYLLKNANGPVVYNGRQYKLNEIEYNCVQNLREDAAHKMRNNSLGVDVSITSLTAILKDISEQKFFTIPNLSDYIPFNVGEGAWANELVTYRTFQFAQDFEDGIIDTATGDSKLSSVDTGVDAVHQKVHSWAKRIGFSLFELKKCALVNNYNLQQQKVEDLKENWDLGIQKTVFLGTKTGGKGLLNFTNAKTDTSVITKPLATMDATEFNTFVETLPAAYRTNAAYSAYPNRLVIPESDYLALVGYTSPNYPLRTKLEVLEQSLKSLSPDFKVLPCAYANKDQNGLGGSKNIYALYRHDPRSLRINIPIPFTMLQVSSINGFNFDGVAIGQFSDAILLRPHELMYFTCNA